MKHLRTDWHGNFNHVEYYSVTQEEYDAICTVGWGSNKKFELAPEYHNYDGFVEKSKMGIRGDAYKAKSPYPSKTSYFILNGVLF